MSRLIWQVDPAHLTPYYDVALCSALAVSGHDVRLFASTYLYDRTLPSPAGYETELLYFRQLNHTWLLDHHALRRGLRAISYPLDHYAFLQRARAERPDVIHFQWLHFPRIDGWLIEQLKRLGIAVVLTVHDVDNLFTYPRSMDYARFCAEVDRVIVHTEANRQALLRSYPSIRSENVAVVPHIAVTFPTPAEASRARARQEHQIPDGALVGLFMGTMRSYKGVDVLIEACLSAQQECADLWIIIAGRCEDKTLFAQFSRLRERASLHLDYVPTSEVWEYHLAADFAIFPYRRVSQSGALITAMTFGLPVIVTDVGGLPETIDGNGWIVPAGDAEALAGALKTASRRRNQLPSMGERSRALIQEKHSAAIVSARLTSIYEEACFCRAFSTVPIT